MSIERRIALVCPGSPMDPRHAEGVLALAAAEFPHLLLKFDPQCFAKAGHFAGDDATRLAAFVKHANDPNVDAVWFGRGGYGANRIAAAAMAQLREPAHAKTYLGYSDNGYLLAALYRHGIGQQVHGPVAGEIRSDCGEDAVRRVLRYFSGEQVPLEAGLDARPTVAFNLITLAMLLGSDIAPDLTGHVVIVEEVSEHDYAVDRLLFSVTQRLRGIAGLRLGRVSDVPVNDREFGHSAEQMARHWCALADIPYLGRADVGHDAMNALVPFGIAGQRRHA